MNGALRKLSFITIAVLFTACRMSLEELDERGRTPLMQAAVRGDSAEVRRLIAEGAYVNAQVPRRDAEEILANITRDELPPSDIGYTPLMYAVQAGRFPVVRALLDAGADARHVARYGQTPLAIALSKSNLPVLRLLTAAGARPDAEQFARAVLTSPPEVVALLARRGADANLQAPPDPQQGRPRSPLLIAATRRGEPAIVKSLLDAGANPNARDAHGWTALRHARDADARPQLPRAAEIVALLEAAGARDDAGTRETALFDAVKRNDPARVRRALRAGANPNARDKHGSTPLINAASSGSAEIVAILAAGGAHLNIAPVYFGSTAMTAAIENGHADVVRTLIAAGARSDQPDGKGSSPMFAAGLHARADILAMLLADSAKADSWSLGIAARRGDTVSVRMLLEYGADPGATIGPLAEALRGCQSQDNTPVIRMLLARGARVEPRNGYTPITRAARWCSAAAVHLILRHGGDPNDRDYSGNTPLIEAARGGKIENVRVLVSAGADFDADAFISAAPHPDVLRELRRLRDSVRSASQ